jgi:hypothetical protein
LDVRSVKDETSEITIDAIESPIQKLEITGEVVGFNGSNTNTNFGEERLVTLQD